MNFPYLTGEVGKLGIARISKHIVSASNAVVYDPFDAPDTPSIVGRVPPIAPIGSAWSTPHILGVGQPRIEILSNKARANNVVDTLNFGVIQAGIANAVLSGNFTLANIANSAGFIIRYQDALNSWWLLAHGGNQKLMIFEYNAGILTIRAEVAATIGLSFSLLASANGDNLSITLGAVTLAYSSAFLNTQTNVGFFLRSPGDTCDNFTVMSL